jgi:photosystem II stability/assembly factor-like uncharacterized protein
VLHTTDGGVSWDVQPTNVKGLFSQLFFIDKDIGWAVGNYTYASPNYYSRILHTVDGGKTWTKQKEMNNYGFGSIHFFDAKNGYVTSSQGVYATTDGGRAWFLQSASPIGGIIDFYDNNNGWLVGTSGTIYGTKP